MSDDQSSVEDLIERLRDYDSQYYNNGDSAIDDAVYDKLRRTAFNLAPHHPYFAQVGSDVRGGKIKLPYEMGSLDQKYTGEITHWVSSYNLKGRKVVITDKYDGISAMLVYRDGKLNIAYSRGNGIEGADITRHVRKMHHIPQTIPATGYVVVRAELEMKNEIFDAKYLGRYKTARAMVAGSFNRSDTEQGILDDIDLIAYQVVAHNGLSEDITSKLEELEFLKSQGFQTARHIVVSADSLNDDFLERLVAERKAKNWYELDGVVITINEYEAHQNKRNGYSLNPEHSVKYKIKDANDIVSATVVAVLHELSKSGYWKPRVQIHPVQLFGTTVTFASGYNARFIFENGIGPGAVVEITKAGSVIPEILNVTKKVTPQMPQGLWEWNDNKVEAVCTDPAQLGEVKFKNVLDFMESIEVEQLRESTLRVIFDKMKLYDTTVSYEDALDTLFDLSDVEWNKYVGANGVKIYNSLRRRMGAMKLPVFLGSLNHFGIGFGIRKATSLLEQVDVDWLRQQDTPDEIAKLAGFDTKTATQVVNGFRHAMAFADKLIADGTMVLVQETKTTELAGFNVVFTGFRDSSLEEKITKMGGKIGSGVSGKTTHLLVASLAGKASTKAKKAAQLGVTTMTADEFKDEYNL